MCGIVCLVTHFHTVDNKMFDQFAKIYCKNVFVAFKRIFFLFFIYNLTHFSSISISHSPPEMFFFKCFVQFCPIPLAEGHHQCREIGFSFHILENFTHSQLGKKIKTNKSKCIEHLDNALEQNWNRT